MRVPSATPVRIVGAKKYPGPSSGAPPATAFAPLSSALATRVLTRSNCGRLLIGLSSVPSTTHRRLLRPSPSWQARQLMHRALLGNKNALHRHADLPAVHECAAEEMIGNLFGIDVVENDCRVVSAELKQNALQVAGSGDIHLFSRSDRSGE